MHLARHAKTWRPLYLLAPLDLKHKNNLLKWAKQLKLGNGLSILADVLVGSFNDLGDILRNRRVLPPVQRIFMALTNIEPEVRKMTLKLSQRWQRQRPGDGEDAATETSDKCRDTAGTQTINRRTRHWWLAWTFGGDANCIQNVKRHQSTAAKCGCREYAAHVNHALETWKDFKRTALIT